MKRAVNIPRHHMKYRTHPLSACGARRDVKAPPHYGTHPIFRTAGGEEMTSSWQLSAITYPDRKGENTFPKLSVNRQFSSQRNDETNEAVSERSPDPN